MTNVVIEDITFNNFEVAAISLNGGTNICIKDCFIKQINNNIKTLSTFSQALFALPHLKRIKFRDSSLMLNLKPVPKSISLILQELEDELEKAKRFVLQNDNYDGIFKNKTGLYDGNAYGIVLNTRGVVIGGFKPARTEDSVGNQHVILQNISINNIITDGTEIIGINCDANTNNDEIQSYGKGQFVGPVGDVLDYNMITNSDGTYKENVYTNAQLIISKHGADKSELGTSNISSDIIEWVENGTTDIKTLIRSDDETFIETGKCNYLITGRDSMGHQMKGNIGLFISQGNDVRVDNILVNNIINRGRHTINQPSHQHANSSGILIVGSNNVNVKNNSIKKIISYKGIATEIELKSSNVNVSII
jgi:hypothetical protein